MPNIVNGDIYDIVANNPGDDGKVLMAETAARLTEMAETEAANVAAGLPLWPTGQYVRCAEDDEGLFRRWDGVSAFVGADAAEVRTSLGLGTAATHANEDYATAAQGTKADAALPKSGGTMTGGLNLGLQNLSGVHVSVASISGAQTNTNGFSDVYYTTDAGSATWTLPGTATVGTQYRVIQGGTGQIAFSAGSGATVLFGSGAHTQTARQGANVMVTCVANADAASAVWSVSGDTA